MSDDNTENRLKLKEKIGNYLLFLRKLFLIRTYRPIIQAALLLFIVTSISISVVPFVGIIRFKSKFGEEWLGFGEKIESWASFSSSIMPMLQTVAAVGTIVTTLYIGIYIANSLEKQRWESESNRELIRLSEIMFDAGFYTKITVPAWEAAIKWCSLGRTGDPTLSEVIAGKEYRMEVAAGDLILPMGNYVWGLAAQGSRGRSVRMHPHYRAYDDADVAKNSNIFSKAGSFFIRNESKSMIKSEMSEHMALTTWIRFWIHVAFLVEKRILEADTVRSLLRDWYEWWFEFMNEYLAVSIILKSLVNGNNLKDHNLIKLQLFQRKVLNFWPDDKFEDNIIFIINNIKEGYKNYIDISLEITDDIISERIKDEYLEKELGGKYLPWLDAKPPR